MLSYEDAQGDKLRRCMGSVLERCCYQGETVHDYRGKRPDLADTLAGACRPQPEIEALELLIGELVEVFAYLLQL